MAYRLLREFRQAFTRLDTPPLSNRRHPGSAVAHEAALQDAFYGKLAVQGIADVFHFVNAQSGFLSALTPLQPRYAKKIADDDSLMAVIVARGIGYGNFRMAETCDIAYHVLEETDRQHIRLASLREACDRISNFIADLPIFPLYTFDPGLLYGSVDGQKFAAAEPTIKARYSRKYFGKGKGVVAYTLLANHVPLETELIGANEHESHYVFDICYHNTTDILPGAITGDMHSVNKANFAILHWFGLKFAPRFTNLQAQLPSLYCASDLARFPPPPAGRADRPRNHSRREGAHRPDRRHPWAQRDEPEHADPKAMRSAPAQPDPKGRLRIRQADPQHLHARLPS